MEYIGFCVDTIIPSRTSNSFSNNKPWVTTDMKNLLNRKKRAFRNGDREQQWRVQEELKMKLKESGDVYEKKLESKLQQNNMKDVWSGMKANTGFKAKENQTEGNLERANEFNVFFQQVQHRSLSHPLPLFQPQIPNKQPERKPSAPH